MTESGRDSAVKSQNDRKGEILWERLGMNDKSKRLFSPPRKNIQKYEKKFIFLLTYLNLGSIMQYEKSFIFGEKL